MVGLVLMWDRQPNLETNVKRKEKKKKEEKEEDEENRER